MCNAYQTNDVSSFLERISGHLLILYLFFSIVHISTICSNEKFSASSLPKLIDGAVITSSREENLNCVITFTTESVLQRFMLRFEDLKLDCNDNLQVGENSIMFDC